MCNFDINKEEIVRKLYKKLKRKKTSQHHLQKKKRMIKTKKRE